MAYINPFIRLSWGGSVRTDDIWVNNLSITATTWSPADNFASVNLNAIKPIIDAAYTGSGGISPFNTLAWYKVALIGTDGKYMEDAKLLENATPIAGTNTGAPAVSPQDSLVVSFRTEITRGLANRGRIYPPAGFQAPSPTTGVLTTSQQQAHATRFTTMINGLNTYFSSINMPLGVQVVSKERNGAHNRVTRVEVGNIMDNQLRRRNKLSEIYVGNDLA